MCLTKLFLWQFVVCTVALVVPEQFPFQLHGVKVDAACYVKVGAPVAIELVALPFDASALEPLPVLFHKGPIRTDAEGPVAVRDGLSHFLDHPALVIVATVGRIDHELGNVALEGVDSSKSARVVDDVEVTVGDQFQVPCAYVGVGKALAIALLTAFVKEVALLRLPHRYGGTGLCRMLSKRQARGVHKVDRLPLCVLQCIVWCKGRQGTAAARLPVRCGASGSCSLAVGKVANVTLLRSVKLQVHSGDLADILAARALRAPELALVEAPVTLVRLIAAFGVGLVEVLVELHKGIPCQKRVLEVELVALTTEFKESSRTAVFLNQCNELRYRASGRVGVGIKVKASL